MRKMKGGVKPSIGDRVMYNGGVTNVIELVDSDRVKLTGDIIVNERDLQLIPLSPISPMGSNSLSAILSPVSPGTSNSLSASLSPSSAGLESPSNSDFSGNFNQFSPSEPRLGASYGNTSYGTESPIVSEPSMSVPSLHDSTQETTVGSRMSSVGGKKNKRKKSKFNEAYFTAAAVGSSLLDTEVDPDLSDNYGGRKTKRKSRSRKKPYSLKKRIR